MNHIEDTLSLHISERLLDVPLLSFDLHEVIEKIKQEESWKKSDRNPFENHKPQDDINRIT